jgi:FkbM family methyltransferase
MTPEIRVESFRGVSFKFACNPDHNASYFTFEDERIVRDRWWDIKPGDVVLDAGAAFGNYALPALAMGAAKVVCWSPENHAPLLRASLRANGWEDRAIVYESGLWNRAGILVAKEHAAMPEYFATPPTEWADGAPPNAFSVSTIDDHMTAEGLMRVDWLKLDVEGAEVEVLMGAVGTLRHMRPKVLVENHLFKDATLKDRVASLLADFGYSEEGTVPYHAISHSLYTP